MRKVKLKELTKLHSQMREMPLPFYVLANKLVNHQRWQWRRLKKAYLAGKVNLKTEPPVMAKEIFI